MSLDRVESIFSDLKLKIAEDEGHYEPLEILILSGEVHPKAKNRSKWHRHIVDICKLAIDYGFFPHTNVGPLSRTEMLSLKKVNASMGLMLEQVTPKLMQNVHRFAPSKAPTLRLEQLRMAGELGIPFTTGILLGIGENEDDRVRTIEAISDIATTYGHIQEVIVQPYSPGEKDRWAARAPDGTSGGGYYDINLLPQFVQMTREMLPDDVVVQIPPNLLNVADGKDILIKCLNAGARDLGGISPKDEVNPNYSFPKTSELSQMLADHGFTLERRSCVHEPRLHLLNATEGEDSSDNDDGVLLRDLHSRLLSQQQPAVNS